jgi:hypothetical protein
MTLMEDKIALATAFAWMDDSMTSTGQKDKRTKAKFLLTWLAAAPNWSRVSQIVLDSPK